MPKGYAEGPAAEEADRRREELERGGSGDRREPALRPAVFGATESDPEPHFIGWLGAVDPDELFSSGKAWGLRVVRRSS